MVTAVLPWADTDVALALPRGSPKDVLCRRAEDIKSIPGLDDHETTSKLTSLLK
jgi:hypothetical protein